MTLPGYSFETTGDDEPEVEWLIDDNSIAALTTSKVDGKLTGEVKTLAAGVAVLTLQVKDTPADKDNYYIVVKPKNAPSSCTADTTYNTVSLGWSKQQMQTVTPSHEKWKAQIQSRRSHMWMVPIRCRIKIRQQRPESAIFIMYMPIQNIRTTDRRIMPIRIPMHP